MEQLTKNQAVATSQEAVQNQNEPQLRDENAHNDKSVHGVLNPTYQAGLRRDAVQPDRKSGSAGMPRPISYAVFCLKKKNRLVRAPNGPPYWAGQFASSGPLAPSRWPLQLPRGGA